MQRLKAAGFPIVPESSGVSLEPGIFLMRTERIFREHHTSLPETQRTDGGTHISF